nr:SPOR domain-containing protein [uncultured Demequina sp.]
MSPDGVPKVEYFFNTRTRMVEQGRQSSWENLMGPYDSYEAAARALETAQERTDAWDEDDREWRGERG